MSKLRISLAFSVLLASGCVAHAPTPLKGGDVGPGVVSADNVAINHPEAQGNLVLRIQWPPRRTVQSLLANADSLTITVRDKSGREVASKSVQRPGDQGGATYLTFALDAGLGEVSVSAVAYGGGKSIAQAGPTIVKLRDNSAVGVSLILDNSDELKIRLDRQLVLLKDLGHYFSRYQSWSPMEALKRPEISGLVNACKAFGDQVSTSYGLRWNSKYPLSLDMAPEGESRNLEELTVPGLTGYAIGFLGWDLVGWLMPNYKITFDTQLIGNTHSVSATLGPSQSNPAALTGFLKAMVAAGTWQRESKLYGVLEAHQNEGPTIASHSIRLAGGEAPDLRTLQVVTLEGAIDPHRSDSGVFAGGLRADSFVDIGSSPFMSVFRAVTPNTELHTWFPTHATASISTPALAAQGQVRLAEDYLSGNAQVNLQIKDDSNAWTDFKATGNLRLTVGQVGNQTAFTGASGSVTIDDVANDLRAVVSIDAHSSSYSYTYGSSWQSGNNYGGSSGSASQPGMAVDLTIRFVDITSGTELGLIRQSFDPAKPSPVGLDAYPVLELKNGDRLRLTPGVFTGQTTGGLSVYIN